jgi:BolA protein
MSDGAPGERLARIEARLRAALQPQLLRLYDDSALHAGHEGAEGLPKLARHRLVYDSLHDLMQREIHALAMTLQSPGEAAGSAD